MQLISRNFFRAVALVVLLAAGPAAAQTVTANGDCPPTIAGTPTVGIILADGVTLRTAPNVDDKVTEGIAFRQSIEWFQRSGRQIFIRRPAAEGVRAICGWAPIEYVLLRSAPLTVEEFNTDVIQEGAPKTKNPLLMKVMIRSSPQTAELLKKDFSAVDTLIFKRPFDDYDLDPSLPRPANNIEGKARVFGIFFVYRSVLREKKADSGARRRWLYVAGTNPFDKRTLAGWVPEDDVFPWESQISVYFSEKVNEPVDIYASEAALRSRDPKGLLASRPNPLVVPKDKSIPKFPLLTSRQGKGGESVFKVAFFGNACLDPNVRGAAECAGVRPSEPEKGPGIHDIAIFMRQLKNVDILFVVDNTKSMSDYFLPIGEAVGQAARVISDLRKDGVTRFAAVVYGDYTEPSLDPQRMDYRSISFSPDIAKVTSFLSAQKADAFIKDFYRDNPEAGYAALKRAVREVRWGTDAAYRVVFWIGDHGNRPVGQNENVGAEDVRKALIERQVGVFVPINVAGAYRKKDNDDFMRDADAITEQQLPMQQRRFKGGFGAIQTHDDGRVVKDVAGAATKVKQAVEGVFKASGELPEWLKELRRDPDLSPPGQQAGPQGKGLLPGAARPNVGIGAELPSAQLYLGPLAARGFTPEVLSRIYKTKSLMTDGFIGHKSGSKALEFWVSMPRKQRELLTIVAEGLCSALRGTNAADAMESMFVQLVSATSGDPWDPQKEDISRFLARTLYLPHEHFSELFHSKLSMFASWWAQNAQSPAGRRLRANVCRSDYLLDRMVRNNRRIELDELTLADAAAGTWDLKAGAAPRTFRWEWELDNGVALTFLPTTYLPGSKE